MPSMTPLDNLVDSFLVHVLRVPDSVLHAGSYFLREMGIACVNCPHSDPEKTSVYVTHNKN